MNLHTVIFIGRSGCGKGTQAALFKDRIYKNDLEKRHILYIQTGERFREFLRGDNWSSRISKDINDAGVLQPGFLACLMWGNQLVEEMADAMHLVFDGVGRTKIEAEMLTTAIEFYKRDKPTVIYIDVSRKWSEERLLSRGRSDDKDLSQIIKRLNWFDKDVMSSIEYFKSNPYYKFIEINGEQPIEKVFSDIVSQYEYGN